MYFPSSVAFLFCLDLNDALWFASRALKLVAVMPMYVLEVSPEVTVAWYRMPLRRHSSFNGQVTFLGQLQSFPSSDLELSTFILFPSIFTSILGIQL